MSGQINLGDIAGDLIFEVSKRDDVKNIVEIGTWNGLGSTNCVIRAIIESNENKNFISIEMYEDMYNTALANLNSVNVLNKSGQNKQLSDYVTLLNGSIIDFEDVFWFNHSEIDFNIDEHARLWYDKDLSLLKISKKVLSELPEQIDFLILDGGEYTTYPEWIKLKDRTRIVALDDSSILKCSKIRKEIIESGCYNTLYDNLNLRNGFSLFQKK
jgi:hypothetical protein